MSFNEGIEVKLHKRRVLDAEIAAYLINNPSCIDNNPQKEDACIIAIEYFVSKQEKSVSKEGKISCNWAEVINLGILIDEYVDAEENGNNTKKRKYTIKIAQYLIDSTEFVLSRIPEETKDIAFRIVIQYLEAMRS